MHIELCNAYTLLSSIVQETDEQKLQGKAAQLSLQGQWIKWWNVLRLDLSWKTVIVMAKSFLSFCLGATYYTLPSPSNLHRWHIHSEPSCHLCSKIVCTTAYILGAFEVTVQLGRFTYCHDSVLQTFLALETVSENLPNHINFVRFRTKIKNSMKKPYTGLLHFARDWRVMPDFIDKLVISSWIVISQLRPDMIFSKMQRACIIIILTCPYEKNMEVWHQKKSWSVHLFPVEVGALFISSRFSSYTPKVDD